MEVSRLLAPNPGLYTGPGTYTYLISSQGEVAVIDPGPVLDEHLEAIRVAIGSDRPVLILVTHTHEDHAPLAGPLARVLDVPTAGFAPGEGFTPDRLLEDGDEVSVGEASLEAIHTPGHSADHLCFRVGGWLFSGDHIAGGSTVFVDDMSEYLSSLDKVKALGPERIFPGHGPQIEHAMTVIDDYIAHRLERERQVLEAVEGGAGTVGEIVEWIYVDVDPALHPLAARSVFAHLTKLAAESRVEMRAGPDSLWATAVERKRS